MADKYLCTECKKPVTPTKHHRYRSHANAAGKPCGMASKDIPAYLRPLDPNAPADVPVEGADFAKCECGRTVELTKLGYFSPHDKTLRGGDRCSASGTRYRPKQDTETISPAPTSESAGAESSPEEPPSSSGVPPLTTTSLEPTAKEGVTCPECNLLRPPMHMAHQCHPVKEPVVLTIDTTGADEAFLDLIKTELGAKEIVTFLQPGSLESTTTPKLSQPSTEPSLRYGTFSATPIGRFYQPSSPFLQPPAYEGPVKAEPMGDLAKQIAEQVKTLFYSHTNRMERTQQTTMGPSEAGSPCDRRLGASLLGLKPVNPGGSGWAPFKGTAVHAALASMFEEADAGSGRFAVEQRLNLNDPHVPHGTCDLIDRTMCLVIDHKVTGKYTLDKVGKGDLNETYRIQGQLYAYAAELAGEKIKNVAIIFWPMESSSLDSMYVHVEKYSRKTAKDALARVDRIAKKVEGGMDAYRGLPAADDCKWCPMHLRGVKGVREDGACGGS